MGQSVVVYTAAIILPLLLHLTLFQKGVKLLYARGITRANFQQEKIPTASGALLVLYSTITWAALLLLTTSYSAETTLGSSFQQAVLLVSGSFAMAVWGWQDDRSQEKEIKGFRGHLRTLIKEGRATSGLTKALGGVSTSFIVSLLLSKGLLEVIVHTGILALSANLINLFDLRPGRAIKVFWLLALSAMALDVFLYDNSFWYWFLPIISSTVLLFPHDAGGRLMLGDTGSNYLGFIAGFCMVTMLPFAQKATFLFFLVFLQVLAEFLSFSRIIEAVPWLRRWDHWGREL